MSRIKEETDEEDDPENNREDGSYGIRNIVNGIFYSSDLRK